VGLDDTGRNEYRFVGRSVTQPPRRNTSRLRAGRGETSGLGPKRGETKSTSRNGGS
jgi:hypothetical protein